MDDVREIISTVIFFLANLINIVRSPPCQPFTSTKNSLHLDDVDSRCAALKYLCRILPTLNMPPKWILLENVKGFATSIMYSHWCDALREAGFTWRNYLLSPKQFGVPNNRTRFYMICERSERFHGEQETIYTELSKEIVVCSEQSYQGKNLESSFTSQKSIGFLIDHYILPLSNEEIDELMISLEILRKPWAAGLSIVGRYDNNSFCFTSSYGKVFNKSSGSLFHMSTTSPLATNALDRSNMEQHHGHIRLFSPKELLLLFGYPIDFQFPDTLSLLQQYRLIGNSISITVVQLLVLELFRPYHQVFNVVSNI